MFRAELLILALISLLSAAAVMADAPADPGFSFATINLQIEAAEDFPEYRFFLVTPIDAEEFSIKKGETASLGEGRGGPRNYATLIAVPRSSFPATEDKFTDDEKTELERSIRELKIAGAIKLASHNFRRQVPSSQAGGVFTAIYRVERNDAAGIVATVVSIGGEDGTDHARSFYTLDIFPIMVLIVPGCLLSLAAVVLGIWLFRRTRRRAG